MAKSSMAERWDAWKAPDTLEGNVKLFFEILDIKEESDEGRVFSPNYISSCRVWDTHRLNKLITKMKELINTRVCRYPACDCEKIGICVLNQQDEYEK
jgi:hypothetical protein